MPSSSDSQRYERPSWNASRSLPVVSLTLVVLFLSSLAGAFFPLEPLEPTWQVRLAIALISGGPLALIALGLLHVAYDLDGKSQQLERRLRFWSQLAIIACLGFALLAPLLVRSTLAAQGAAYERQMADVKAKERKVASLRLAMGNSTSAAELNQKFRELQGPNLVTSDLALPLPELKRLLEEKVFQESDRVIARQRQALPPKLPVQVLPDLLSRCLAALALSLGFSALARRPGCQISLLQEARDNWNRRHLRNQSRRGRTSQEMYIRQLSGDE